MKAFLCVTAAFFTIIGLLWWEQAWTKEKTDELIAAVEQIEDTLFYDPKSARELFDAYEDNCRHTMEKMLFFAHHEDLTEVRRLNARLEAYLQTGEYKEALVTVAELKIALDSFSKKEKPTLRNLF